MPRIFLRLMAVVVLLGAWAVVGSDRPPLPLSLSHAVAAAGPRGEAGPNSETPRAPDKANHDLSSLRIFTKVIIYVKDNYVDPKRVRPKEMMLAALEHVEKSVPDVLVDGNAETGKLKLTVNGKTRDFDISHVDSLWKMSFSIKDCFDFIQRNMRPIDDTRDIEYAAVNGMLTTLDPHSVLLRPEMYREMKLTTKGEFGGLGFVIQMKEGNLTVVKVLPKTPAYRALIKKDDQIKKIGEESTVNMDLNEAVSKLRGPVDSKVTITVDRKGWEKPQAMTLTRALINIESVQSKMLANNVGYVRLKNFQGNTTRHLQAALDQLQGDAKGAGGLKGLVLDLRGNPGGLLEQAIQVSDLFLSQGTIVATVGLSDKLREEKKAHADEGDLAYPIAVLVNAGSASASEIVAGALKNLNRAVVIGRQTFGKGSVQVLYDMDNDSALKLTIAKYLTPGDVSIQEVGIVPDIALVPTRVTKDRIDVFAPRRSMGEADLDQHFGNPSSAAVAKKREDVLNREKPLEQLKYLKEDPKQKDPVAKAPSQDETSAKKGPKDAAAAVPAKRRPGEKDPLTDVDIPGTDEDLDDQLDAESQDEIKEDFEVTFAHDYVLRAPFTDRDKMLKGGKPFVEEKRKDEDTRINNAIGALGVDWSEGPPQAPKNAQLVTTIKPGPERKIAAGELVDMEVTVENRGPDPVNRLRGWTVSENPIFDRREFVFGALKPGEKRSWRTPVKTPKEMTSRRDEVSFKLFDDHGPLQDNAVTELNFIELTRPAFAYNWQVIDNCAACNGDGQIQRGEEVDLLVDITNTGSGRALDAFAQIKNAGGENIFIEKGRFKLGELGLGETKTARFVLEVKKAYRDATFPLKLAIIDEPLEEFATEKVQLPVVDTAVTVPAKKSVLKLADRTTLWDSPKSDARPLAILNKGGTVASVGEGAGYFKVEWDKNRFAFVREADAKDVKAKAVALKDLQFLPFRTPPQIALNADPGQGAVVVDGDKFLLTGVVSDPKTLLDMYVLLNDQKVFFKGAGPADPGGGVKIPFTAELPLKEGNNVVVVVARETPEFNSRKGLIIRRRPAAVAQKLGKPAVQTVVP